MRLWHYKLIPFLPSSQLIAQWRELNSIFKKSDNNLLINYIYQYGKPVVALYTSLLLEELEARDFKLKTWDTLNDFFSATGDNRAMDFLTSYSVLSDVINQDTPASPFFKEHNQEYLIICYFNLYEKYLRGQKDFSKDRMENLAAFVSKETNLF